MPYVKPDPWSFTVSSGTFDSEVAVRLRAAVRVELNGLLAGPDRGAVVEAPDVVVLFVARDSAGVPVGAAGLVAAGDGVYEIRHLFVRSDARNLGVGEALVQHLVVAARGYGSPALVIETGMQAAVTVRFLERFGFGRIAPFGPYRDNPQSLCFAYLIPPTDVRASHAS